jgi:hypothetical protein
MKAKSLLIAATLAMASLGAGIAGAGEKAKIERAAAEKIALTRVPGGMIKEGELETEHGKLVWSFDIAQKASPDIIEVQVDAMTGEVVAMEIETPDDQAKEAADDESHEKKK